MVVPGAYLLRMTHNTDLFLHANRKNNGIYQVWFTGLQNYRGSPIPAGIRSGEHI